MVQLRSHRFGVHSTYFSLGCEIVSSMATYKVKLEVTYLVLGLRLQIYHLIITFNHKLSPYKTEYITNDIVFV